MSDPFELPKELLHEVTMRTIEIDNLSNKIIRTSFGLDLKFSFKDNKPLNLERIYRFNDFFLENLGSSSRADLLLEIIKEINQHSKEELKPCKDFKNKLITFYKIRNIFAHNIYPKDLHRKTKLDSAVPHWIELNKQHEELYKELKGFFMTIVSFEETNNSV